ncbi:MAG: zf-HC2 domain-containing protein [bacterium]|nr:zf-HC2 domain-containing protein [bacterium]
MSCKTFESLIALHVEGDLTAAETEELERHLRGCAVCRGFADEMRASQRALKKHGRSAVDPAVLAGIRTGVLRRIERRRRAWPGIAVPRPRRFPTRVLALAASLVLVLGAAVLLLRWGEISRPEPAWESSEIEPAPTAPTAAPTPTHAPPPAPEPATPPTPTGPRQAVPRQALPRQAVPRPVEEPATPRIAAQQELPASPRSAEEPMVIKLVSDDLVIYWLVEPEATQEEKDHEISTT